MSYEYPVTMPEAAINDVISAIQNRAFDKQKLGKDLWLVEGYLLNRALGEPTGVVQGLPLSDELATMHLTNLLQGVDIPWKQVALWAAQLVLKLLA